MLTQQHLFKDIDTLISYLDSFSIAKNLKVLVQIYTTNKLDILTQINSTILDYFSNPIIVGGKFTEIICDGQIYYDQTAIIITTINDVHCDVIYQNNDNLTDFIVPKPLYNQPHLPSHLQMLSTLSPSQNQVLIGTIKAILPNSTISGGIFHNDCCLFYMDKFITKGFLSIVFYSDNLLRHQFNTTSVIPIGREHIITKANGHRIDSIDNIPAKLFYESYLSTRITVASDLYGYKFPLLIQKGNVTLPSPIYLCDDSNCIHTKLQAKTSDKVTLGYGDSNFFVTETKKFNQQLKNIPCEYLTNFASRSRTLEFINHIDDSNLYLPIFGLLTDFEFIEDQGVCHMTSENNTMTSLSSSYTSFITPSKKEITVKTTPLEIEHSILLKLVENTSKELNTLNKTLENLVEEKTNELLDNYYTDYLTKLPNFNKLSEDIIESNIFSLSLIDISSFININNFYGATIGNKVLKELADLIVKSSHANNLKTYRLNSDIFAVASYIPKFQLFCDHMEELQGNIHKHCFVSQNQQIYINTTIGISNMHLALYENTSMTLQHAKTEKKALLIYDEALKIEDLIISNLTWTSKIRIAIDQDRIIPYFQPIYNNATQNIDRFEVLMRLNDENDRVVTPAHFLAISKKAGLYHKLTKIMVTKAFDYFSDKPYKFSLNLSADDIVNQETRNYIYNHLAKFSMPENVIFELVESESIENYDMMVAFINEVKKYGATIAIDDFGTGFSNFHYLFKLNVDCIKIDGTIIQQMITDPSAEIVAETIVSFANKLGITTVAEYVSDEEIFEKVKALGIGFSQGFFIARPGPDIVM